MTEYITCSELKIKCNIKISRLRHLSIRESIGTHAMAEITADIEPGSLDLSCEELNNQPLMICSVKDLKELLIFSGVIGKIRIEKESAYDLLYLSAYSLSWLMDLERKNRSFQDCNESVLGLIQKIVRENSFNLLCSAEDKAVTNPFIQYEETDWEFLLRLSTHVHAPFIAACDYKGRGIYLGFQENRVPLELSVTGERWCMDSECKKSINWRTREAAYYEVDTVQILHLGQCVSYRDEILWPYHVRLNLQNGHFRCTCKLAGKNHNMFPTIYNPHIKGISLAGTVLERKEEAIRIHLDIDEEQDAGMAYLYPWFPENGNMAYCMPETGSRVRLLIPGEDERKAVGIHCVRQNGQVCEEMQNPDNRWFTTVSEKKMALKPSDIELSADGGQSGISIQDGIGDIIRSGGEVLIQAKGKVAMHGARIELRAPTEITAIKRQLGSPAVVNICHNLDAMGEYSSFNNLNELKADIPAIGPGFRKGNQVKADNLEEERRKKEKEKLQLKLKKLSEEDKEGTYEFGSSILNIISSIPQSIEQDRLSQIAVGFRPIAGRMKGE
ncbi:hypothetical protein [Lacrimispora sp.]|uniref:hypothetical protein n=1 Tax=Lacrimispora sp. TaxID=2719234 RepID=UPI0028AF28B5|nr:hypothetical protein [Lacrimispora sp.]